MRFINVMYEWLQKEVMAVRTPRFHIVDGFANSTFQDIIARSDLPLPASYKEFVSQFGNAKLYRCSRGNYYEIHVFAGPREEDLSDGSRVYWIGYRDDAKVYLMPEFGAAKCPVYESEVASKRRVADDFEEWLVAACRGVRDSYGVEKWAEIIRGPAPFSAEEEHLLVARRRIRWQACGIDATGNQIIKITNSADRTLPVLTVGVRSQDRRLNGAVHLQIGHIRPGSSDVLHVPCYKDLVRPEELELFELPDPRPEDREYYPELARSVS